ncbi:MAG TPA: hypothetical protein VGE63_01515 [Candidatus Paceibacterota bacterium]
MIKEFEFFHGLVFARILHGTQRPLSLKPFPSGSNASYIINEKTGIYIKYSSKRMTPWRFSFAKQHQEEIELMKSTLKEVYLLLVCNDDGVVCLNYSELKQILDDQHEAIEWISANRHKREMYTVKGSNGELGFKIGPNDFPGKLFDVDAPKGILGWFK